MKQVMQYTLAEIFRSFSDDFIKELDIRLQGDPDCVIKGVCTIQEGQSNHITFLVNPAYKKYLATTQASAVILSAQDADACTVNAIITRNPYFVYAKVAAFFDRKPKPVAGIHPTAVIGEGCQIDPTASIGANCVIGDQVKIGAKTSVGPNSVVGSSTQIGDNTRLEANVTVYDHMIIGNNVQLASGVVIGSDGFGIAKFKGAWTKVPQVGRVIIEDNVDIGANTTVDRGAINDTVIGKGVQLDNLIQVGHNVRIGENTAIAGCVGISGSATIGKNCLIGGASGIGGHITIADNVVVTGATSVSKSIREPGVYSSGVGGLVTNLEWRKNSARLRRLDRLAERVRELEAVLNINSEKEKEI